jgi:hypothetical protein
MFKFKQKLFRKRIENDDVNIGVSPGIYNLGEISSVSHISLE